MLIKVKCKLKLGVTAKDVALYIIGHRHAAHRLCN